MKKIIIIGSGPGGYYAAVLLSKAGFEVTLIDKGKMGGTCLNVGCIPTKSLLDNLSLFEHFRDSATKKKMFTIGEIGINHEGLIKHQQEVIKQLSQGLGGLFKKKKINFIQAEAKLIEKNKVLVKTSNSQEEIAADEIVLATGSRPRSIPGFEFDGNLVVSSDDVWNIPTIPQNLLIVGSGPIGIEFARVFNLLGSKVTVVEIQEKICPILDNELSENLIRSLKRRGITIKPNFATKFIEKKEKSIRVEFLSTVDSQKESAEYDQILIAVGRKPNIESLGLDEIGIEKEKGVFIKVNSSLRTNINNIWAVGDVTDYPQLAHTASFQARIVAANISGHEKVFDGRVIPACIYGYPEVAFVGETEESLKERKADYKIGKFLFLASGKAKASGLTEGLVKILMDNKTKKILGAHIIGPEASNLIHELSIAMQNHITVEQLVESIHAHPTYSEVVLEALEDCLGEAVHA